MPLKTSPEQERLSNQDTKSRGHKETYCNLTMFLKCKINNKVRNFKR